MTERSHIEDVEFLLDVLDARPGTSVLAIEAGPASAVVAENVGPHGRVRVAPSVTRAHEFAQWEKFDRIYALDIPDLREDTAAAAALAPLLTDDGQLWVIDGAGPGHRNRLDDREHRSRTGRIRDRRHPRTRIASRGVGGGRTTASRVTHDAACLR
ncbi:hypothetical protein [Rhodococcus pyridinivorans]|uniref:hypothetical protein n=1 Tax=Rhodococcus pyridinivorans TaxID=103816 RepID=UPI002078CCEF|nr:hypothetical protein [Rhodococcus pyridinivorans]USI91299.1 hypothetical protein LLA01_05190 [Rhodococcus pyridinivorans]